MNLGDLSLGLSLETEKSFKSFKSFKSAIHSKRLEEEEREGGGGEEKREFSVLFRSFNLLFFESFLFF